MYDKDGVSCGPLCRMHNDLLLWCCGGKIFWQVASLIICEDIFGTVLAIENKKVQLLVLNNYDVCLNLSIKFPVNYSYS